MLVRTALLFLWFIAGIVVTPKPAIAEWYLAGTAGVNFADRINTIGGTGPQAGLPGPFVDFDLQNSLTYGAKAGYFPRHSWFGIEGEVLHTSPHIKSLPRTPTLEEVPGIHFRLTTVGANFIARYPGRTFQPYVGAGIGMAIARIGETATVRSDTDVTAAWNLLIGLRAFLTPQIAVFTEYKYQGVSLQFDQAFGSDGGFAGNYRAQHILGGLSYHF
ncbi:MAG: porin family protein [Nitrospira sp.]|nr:porin family protein [Nitrospira sp.]MBH0182696.1 porin family protein [Nitrospira sp.]